MAVINSNDENNGLEIKLTEKGELFLEWLSSIPSEEKADWSIEETFAKFEEYYKRYTQGTMN